MENRINEILRKKDMTQGELAERVGCHREYLNRIITRAIANPSLKYAIRIATALDLTVEKVFALSLGG